MSFGVHHRKFLVRERLADAVRAWRGRHRSSKDAAREVGSTPRTVENWLADESAPQAHHLIELMRASDDVWAAVCELAGRDHVSLTVEQRQAVTAALRLIEGDKR